MKKLRKLCVALSLALLLSALCGGPGGVAGKTAAAENASVRTLYNIAEGAKSGDNRQSNILADFQKELKLSLYDLDGYVSVVCRVPELTNFADQSREVKDNSASIPIKIPLVYQSLERIAMEISGVKDDGAWNLIWSGEIYNGNPEIQEEAATEGVYADEIEFRALWIKDADVVMDPKDPRVLLLDGEKSFEFALAKDVGFAAAFADDPSGDGLEQKDRFTNNSCSVTAIEGFREGQQICLKIYNSKAAAEADDENSLISQLTYTIAKNPDPDTMRDIVAGSVINHEDDIDSYIDDVAQGRSGLDGFLDVFRRNHATPTPIPTPTPTPTPTSTPTPTPTPTNTPKPTDTPEPTVVMEVTPTPEAGEEDTEPDAQSVSVDSSKEEIFELQYRLIKVNALDDGGTTKVYDEATRAAVLRFQQWFNETQGEKILEETGECDILTHEHLQKAVASNQKIEDEPIASPTPAPTPKSTPTPNPEPASEPTPTTASEAPEVKVVMEYGDKKEYFVPIKEESLEDFPPVRTNAEELKIQLASTDEEWFAQARKDFNWTLTLDEDSKEANGENPLTLPTSKAVEGEIYTLMVEYSGEVEGRAFTNTVALRVVIDKTCDAQMADPEDPDSELATPVSSDTEKLMLRVGADEELAGDPPFVEVNGEQLPLTFEQELENGDSLYSFAMTAPLPEAFEIHMTDAIGNPKTFSVTAAPDGDATEGEDEQAEEPQDDGQQDEQEADLPEVSLDADGAAPGKAVTGKTEPGLRLQLYLNEGLAGEACPADENGMFSLQIPADAQSGTIYQIALVDEEGVFVSIVPERTVTVLAAYAEVKLAEGLPTVYELNAQDAITLTGATGAGELLGMFIGEERISNVIIPADNAGVWEMTINASMLDAYIREDQSEYELVIRDLDGGVAADGLAITLKLDKSCALSVEPYVHDAMSIAGFTDPGANVTCQIGSVQLSAVADETGRFEISLNEALPGGSTVEVSVEDESGNTNSCAIDVPMPERVKISFDIIYAGVNGVQADGQAKAGSEVMLLVNGQGVGYVAAEADGSFSIRSSNALEDGANTFELRYVEDDLAEFAADPIEMTVDAVAPQILMDRESVTVLTGMLEGAVSEPAQVQLFVDGELVKSVDAQDSFGIEVSDLEAGMQLRVVAVDNGGNSSIPCEFSVEAALDALVVIESPAIGEDCDFMNPLAVKGYVLCGEAEIELWAYLEKSGSHIELTEDAASLNQLGARHAEQLQAQKCLRFEISQDIENLPIGENVLSFEAKDAGMNIAFMAMNGEKLESLQDGELKLQIVKSASFVPKRVFLLAALLAGAVLSLVLLMRINKRIRLLQNSTIDSKRNESSLTINRRSDR